MSPSATRSRCAGCSSRSTNAQPSAAIRFDIDAMWISATSNAIPRMRTSGGSDDQASTIRPNRASSVVWPESKRCTAVATSATMSSSAARSARLSDAATAAIASGCTNASDPSRVSKAATRRSKVSPCADPGPAHDASPIRCPSRRVRSNRSTVPSGPSSATVCSSARSRLTRYEATSSRRNNELGSVRLPSKISPGSLRRNIK